MNRKLQRSVTALSATAAVFGLLLFAGGPPQATPSSPLVSAAGADLAAGETASFDAGAPATAGSHKRRSRTALALPYFSFAQGLRRVGS